MKLEIIIVCKSCEYKNSMELDISNFEPLQTEYESLTNALEHMKSNEFPHDMVIVLREAQ